MVLLLFMAILLGGSSRQESAGLDEVAHIGAGLSYLQKFDLRLNEEHPPLAKVLAAIPLALVGAKADYAGPVWAHSSGVFSGMGGQWVFGSQVLMRWNEPRNVLLLARVPMILITLLLGWCIFEFALRLGGAWAGLLCLSVYVSTPIFLAYGPLVMTDATHALTALLTVWTFASFWRTPSRGNILRCGLALGAAVLAKFSAGILFLVLAVFAAISLRWPIRETDPPSAEPRAFRRVRLVGMLRVLGVAAAAVYCFELILSWNQPMDIPGLQGGGAFAHAFGRSLMPAWIYFRGMAIFLVMSSRGTYLFNRSYWHGVWFFFPVLLLLKSAPGFIGLEAILVVLAKPAAAARRDAGARWAHHWRMIWVGCAVFSATCIASHYNSAFRHFVFPLTLLILLLSALPAAIGRLQGPRLRWMLAGSTALLASTCLVTAARAYPNYIPFVSVFGGGRAPWSLVFASDLDFDQGLYELRDFADRNHITDLPVAGAINARLQAWIPQARLWDCRTGGNDAAGEWVAASAATLQDGRACAWLRQYSSRAVAGGSMLVFQLPAAIPEPGSPTRPQAPPDNLEKWGVTGSLEAMYGRMFNRPEEFPQAAAKMEIACRELLGVYWQKALRKLHLGN